MEEVSLLSPVTQKALENVAINRLRLNNSKLKAVKTKLRILRMIVFCIAFTGIAITCFSLVLDRRGRTMLPAPISRLTLDGTLAHNGTFLLERMPALSEIKNLFG